MLPQIGMPELFVLGVVCLLPLVIVFVGARWLLPRLAKGSLKWWQKTQMEVKRELEEEEHLNGARN